jgi:hypothetical protein
LDGKFWNPEFFSPNLIWFIAVANPLKQMLFDCDASPIHVIATESSHTYFMNSCYHKIQLKFRSTRLSIPNLSTSELAMFSAKVPLLFGLNHLQYVYS